MRSAPYPQVVQFETRMRLLGESIRHQHEQQRRAPVRHDGTTPARRLLLAALAVVALALAVAAPGAAAAPPVDEGASVATASPAPSPAR